MSDALEALQEALNAAWTAWREVPDGSRYRALTLQLGLFIDAVIQDNLSKGSAFTARIPGLNHEVRIRVSVKDERRIIITHHYVTDLDELVGEYFVGLCEKYLKFPDIQHVRSAAYIRMGITQKAYTLERKMKTLRVKEIPASDPHVFAIAEKTRKRKISFVSSDDDLVNPEDSPEIATDYGDMNVESGFPADESEDSPVFERLETLWFYPYMENAVSKRLPPSFKGLSLRYIYVVLRYHSGAALGEIAKELNITQGRLTELKKEYNLLFPQIHSDAWLNLEVDFKQIRLKDPVLYKMNLKGVHRRYSLLKYSNDPYINKTILRSKRIFWRLFQLAVMVIKESGEQFLDALNVIVLDENNRPDVKMTVMQDAGSLCLTAYWRLGENSRDVVA